MYNDELSSQSGSGSNAIDDDVIDNNYENVDHNSLYIGDNDNLNEEEIKMIKKEFFIEHESLLANKNDFMQYCGIGKRINIANDLPKTDLFSYEENIDDEKQSFLAKEKENQIGIEENTFNCESHDSHTKENDKSSANIISENENILRDINQNVNLNEIQNEEILVIDNLAIKVRIIYFIPL